MTQTRVRVGAAPAPVAFDAVAAEVRSREPALVALSHSLHAEPETAMQEHRSAAKVARLAASDGFDVTTGVGGLPTALTAVRGSGPLTLGVCVEYDALPGIGHGCGHNVNAAAATGAALALGALADRLGITVKLIGTPAEEGEGGKVHLLDAGVFDDVAAAMMAHASDRDAVNEGALAMSSWTVTYHGHPAHAAQAPWSGVNALDAASVAYVAIGLLRQQLPPGSVVSMTIGEGGGDAANVIPCRARAHVEVRAPDIDALRRLQERVRACLEAGALATGATSVIAPRGADFAELRQDACLSAAYADGLRRLGRAPIDAGGAPQASTDMGNVSLVVPSIHPTIGYDVGGAAFHTGEFAAHGCSASADRAIVDAAIALAWAGACAAGDPAQRRRLVEGARSRAVQRGAVTPPVR